jgi:hypothetical protein
LTVATRCNTPNCSNPQTRPNATNTSRCSQTPAVQPVGYSDGGGPADLSIALNQKTNTLYATNVNSDNQTADSVYVINAASCNATSTSGCD